MKEVRDEAKEDSPIERWMTRDPMCVPKQTSLARVASLMFSSRHSCVVIVENDKPVGIISERDLVGSLSDALHGQSASATAAQVMSTPVVSIRQDEAVDEATRLMTSRQIRRLVVVDDQETVVGIVTQSDMMRSHVERIEQHQRRLEAQVAERTAELETTVEQLEVLSRIDPLMGIGNRRAMEEALAMAHQRSARYRRIYSVILLDVDKFKAYNDAYGHPRGDRVLRDIASEVNSCIRIIDKAYRYGGEEVLVLLPETGADGALSVAERIRRSVAALAIEHQSSRHGVLTVSAGIASSVPRPDGAIPGVLDLLDAADQSLYKAKDSGRNCLGPVEHPG